MKYTNKYQEIVWREEVSGDKRDSDTREVDWALRTNLMAVA